MPKKSSPKASAKTAALVETLASVNRLAVIWDPGNSHSLVIYRIDVNGRTVAVNDTEHHSPFLTRVLPSPNGSYLVEWAIASPEALKAVVVALELAGQANPIVVGQKKDLKAGELWADRATVQG